MTDSDREAVRAIRGGNREALAHLVQRYQGRLFGLVLMMVRAPEPAADAQALSSLIASERDREIWRAVAALSSGERTAVILYYREELTVRDIANALGVTTGTVKTLLFRARRHLRERLRAANAIEETGP